MASPTSESTAVSGLIAGTYVFQFKIVDNLDVTATATVNVVVNAASTNITISAGSAQTITLPTSSTTLTGTVTDKTATIKSYAWTETSGPNTATMSYPADESTAVSGLVAGTYVFQFKIVDNLNVTATATVDVTVNAATTKKKRSAALLTDSASVTPDAIAVTETDSISKATNKISLYPNPSHSSLILKLSSNTNGQMSISIFDMAGHLVLIREGTKLLPDYQGSVDISPLSSGVYTMQVLVGKTQKMSIKFIKQ
jgi:hypothetical protein